MPQATAAGLLAAVGAFDVLGEYTYAWWGGAATCLIAAVQSLLVVRHRSAPEEIPA